MSLQSVVLGLLKVLLTGLIAFAIWGLSLRFILSYLNQSQGGRTLTMLNFAIPLLLTVVLLIITAFLLFYRSSTRVFNLNVFLKTSIGIVVLVLLSWQTWYITTLYDIKQELDFTSLLTELLPIVIGGIAAIYLATTTVFNKNAS